MTAFKTELVDGIPAYRVDFETPSDYYIYSLTLEGKIYHVWKHSKKIGENDIRYIDVDDE